MIADLYGRRNAGAQTTQSAHAFAFAFAFGVTASPVSRTEAIALRHAIAVPANAEAVSMHVYE